MTAPSDYSGDAYRACLRGAADANQQQSAASQIILLHAEKGRLLQALGFYADPKAWLTGPHCQSVPAACADAGCRARSAIATATKVSR